MGIIISLANFFKYSPKQQKCLEKHASNYPDSSKSKLIPLCRTRWVERIYFFEVTLDLMKAVIKVLIEMHGYADNSWNRDTSYYTSIFTNQKY